ncbi:elongation of very long chain fatty acids protein 4-like [Leptopilina boulardi]|uniref:elongation of very long chain fatty acids protein 4-like n=1 Tax=Leptopilina boulardi TaxID=63433 RepID=UPI0021F59FCE|nr:elongation of very long chain fatty acids protein 4-like [Leptopilina boulardi]
MSFMDTFNYYYYDQADTRVKGLLFMDSPWPMILILFSYLYFVFQCGPRFMKNRPAYELKSFIKFYNIFQIISNAYLVKEILAVHPDAVALRCMPIDYSNNPDAVRMVRMTYFVFLLKIVDLIETGMFVLRKKYNQISWLHLYHHFTTALVAWISTRYIAGGMAVFYPAMNCSVHVIMYTYYLLSTTDSLKRYVLPFKRYVTIIQMVQFVILIFHALIATFPSCAVPKLPAYLMILDVLFNFNLFYNFYKRTYLTPKKKKE